MFWTLVLAHFIADFPLQSDGMVMAKKQLPGLLMHITIHLLVMSVLIFAILGLDPAALWPFPLAVALCHLIIDALKNVSASWWPRYIISTYLADQILHILSILMVAAWYSKSFSPTAPALPWILPAIAFVLVTHFALVTEKICTLTNQTLLARTLEQGLVRMLSRATLLAALLIGPTIWGALSLLCGFCFHFPETKGDRPRIFSLDAAWVIGGYLFLRLAD